MNQDLIEKNYYEQLIVGHYIDAKYSEQEWKMGKLIDKDKKYAVISFEGINSK
jgi:tRNA U34 2-thiouridine synthase MnmA/TrmU